MAYLTLSPGNLDEQHICCAFSDRRCDAGTARKKAWLRSEYAQGYRFRRLDERAKVFIEYAPVKTPGCLALGCFRVSGRYARNGHGKALLAEAIAAARQSGLTGIIAITGKKKFHFMSDGKWLGKQGFTARDSTPAGFEPMAPDLGPKPVEPRFTDAARAGRPRRQSSACFWTAVSSPPI